jgi:hypothetical protein
MKNVIIAFVEWLHREIPDCKPCALVLDIPVSGLSDLLLQQRKPSGAPVCPGR